MKSRSTQELLVKKGQKNDLMVFAKKYLVAFGYMNECQCPTGCTTTQHLLLSADHILADI